MRFMVMVKLDKFFGAPAMTFGRGSAPDKKKIGFSSNS